MTVLAADRPITQLSLLGGLEFRHAGKNISIPVAGQRLLAFLALSGDHRAARDRVATLLWPDSPEEAARQSLRQCISVMRRDIPHLQLTADHDVVMLDVSTLAIDVREFESSIATSDAAALGEAINLYAVALRSGKMLKYDPAARTITNVPDANKYLDREYRPGYEI